MASIISLNNIRIVSLASGASKTVSTYTIPVGEKTSATGNVSSVDASFSVPALIPDGDTLDGVISFLREMEENNKSKPADKRDVISVRMPKQSQTTGSLTLTRKLALTYTPGGLADKLIELSAPVVADSEPVKPSKGKKGKTAPVADEIMSQAANSPV